MVLAAWRGWQVTVSHITHAPLLAFYIPPPFYQAFYCPPYIGHNGLALLLLRENGADAEWRRGFLNPRPCVAPSHGPNLSPRVEAASDFYPGVVLPDIGGHLHLQMDVLQLFILISINPS